MALQNSTKFIRLISKNKINFTPIFLRNLSTPSNSAKSGASKKSTPKAQSATPPPPSATLAFTYQSKATPSPSQQPVGPGALKTGEYKNSEYYSYNAMSYFDLEAEMVKDRLPQPSAGNEQY